MNIEMYRKFICCFKSKSTNNNNTSFVDVLETSSIYNSMELLNDTDKPVEWKDTISFVPPIEKGVVIKVYDGDTITIASKLPYSTSPLYRFSVRLNGIDCPEMKSKNQYEKECAVIAREEVSKKILHKIVTLKNIQTEKYGRILADVYIDDLCINNYMIEKRLAIAYDGGTKISPSNWMNYYLKNEL